MVLMENIQILSEKFPVVWKVLKEREDALKNQPFIVEESRSGHPTLAVQKDEGRLYLHSKYHPIQEAEKFVAQFKNEVEQYEHLFFYGVGLGYHIEALMNAYPNKTFTIYEPEIGVFYRYLTSRPLNKLPMKQLKWIYLETSSSDRVLLLNDFAERINQSVLFLSLPSYQRVFKESYEQFSSEFSNALITKQANLTTSYAFAKLWIKNSLKNFPKVISTPNFNDKKAQLSGKPVLLVSAGPSLNEELDNIRKIKGEGLAYIFAVGSAVDALAYHGIMPDAVFGYDPLPECLIVFKPIIEKGLEIPLAFGSSIGFEVTQNYTGPMLHMIISQDTLSQYCLRRIDGEKLSVVNDAPTIALVTMQLLCEFGCNPIILVGQNLAYKDRAFYADGINHSHVSSVVTERMEKEAIPVKDVNGGQIYTSKSFYNMRLQIERLIKEAKYTDFINTTQGGAKIEGTTFVSLHQMISEKLLDRVVKDKNWYKGQPNVYDTSYLLNQYERLNHARKELISNIKTVLKNMGVMEPLIAQKNNKQLGIKIDSLNKVLKQIFKNDFFTVFVSPILRVDLELLNKQWSEIQFETDVIKKAEKINQSIGRLMLKSRREIEEISPLFDEIGTELIKECKTHVKR